MIITKPEYCTGCMLCVYNCPVNAIKINNIDESMFYIPKIDNNICINCGKCKTICPVNNNLEMFEQIQFYIAQEKNEKDLIESTSGGISNVLAKNFISRNGVVYGAAFNSKMELIHIRCTSAKDCEKIRGSKYVQSNISNIYSMIDSDLKIGKEVLFIGTPCQCAAVQKQFGSYEYFYCCDFVCNGVGSPLVFREHIHWLEQLYSCKIKNYIFRPKKEKYLEPYEMFIDCMNKTYRYKSPWKKWGSLYYADFIMRDSCFDCHYSSNKRISNLTLSDIPIDLIEQHLNDFPNDVHKFGASLISANNQKGIYMLKMIEKEVFLKETITNINSRKKRNIQCVENKNAFLKLAKVSLKQAKNKFLGRKLRVKSILIDIIEWMKKVV